MRICSATIIFAVTVFVVAAQPALAGQRKTNLMSAATKGEHYKKTTITAHEAPKGAATPPPKKGYDLKKNGKI
jgi:hypothetical protein